DVEESRWRNAADLRRLNMHQRLAPLWPAELRCFRTLFRPVACNSDLTNRGWYTPLPGLLDVESDQIRYPSFPQREICAGGRSRNSFHLMPFQPPLPATRTRNRCNETHDRVCQPKASHKSTPDNR